jgi:cobalt-zinc-cadmium efflux system membrane fusion protein
MLTAVIAGAGLIGLRMPQRAFAGSDADAHGRVREAHIDAHETGHNQDDDHAHGGEWDGPRGDEHDHSGETTAPLSLSREEIRQLGIELAEAVRGTLDFHVSLPGEVRLNEDNLAHVVPKLAGIVREVNVTLGDSVERGRILAVLNSRELAAAKADYLAARERLHLAEATFRREQGLWDQRISAEKDYLEAKNALAEARIVLRATEQELQALGFAEAYIRALSNAPGDVLTRYEIAAPFDGTILEKHITLGEYVESNSDVFTVADLNTVWVDVNVYQRDLSHIRQGQEVVLSGPDGIPPTTGTISYVAPLVDRETRTALARVVLPNTDGQWRPGLFLDVEVAFASSQAHVIVPKPAVQRIGDDAVVFVEYDRGFRPVPVSLGRESGELVEITAGLLAGGRYVAKGAFELKAKLVTSGMGSHAGHGH